MDWLKKDLYKGKFDQGWDAIRQEILARQIKMGIVPPGAKLAANPDSVKKWATLSADEKKLFSRQMEVYATLTEHADHEVGRLVKGIEDLGVLDNTLFIYIFGDNGGSIANSVGMQGKTLGFGQVYLLESQKDSTGAWLDGGKSYRLRVPPNPPVKQFWSFTVYDNLTRGPVVTPQGAADISSRKPGLVKNADGSVDLYFGPTPPKGANANFVQTLPGKGWFTYFRLYGPLEAYFNKSWQLNDIEPVK